MIEIYAALGCLVLMALFLMGAVGYFKRIRDGRADPLVNPGWTTMMRPTGPPSSPGTDDGDDGPR